jgi:general stress protein YciG
MAGKRGFAAMDKDAQRAIASKGGRAAHARGTAHEFTSQEAAEAGRKGGRSVSRDRGHMAEIGRKGGKAAHTREESSGPEPTNGEPMAASSHLPAADNQTPPGGPMPVDNRQFPAPNGPAQVPGGQMPGASGQMPVHGGEQMTAGT